MGSVSTWMGDRLGIPSVVGSLFFPAHRPFDMDSKGIRIILDPGSRSARVNGKPARNSRDVNFMTQFRLKTRRVGKRREIRAVNQFQQGRTAH